MIFDSKKLEKLNNPKRSEWIPTEALTEALGLQQPHTLIDFGAGTGFFTSALAGVFPETRFCALDVQKEMITYLKQEMPENVEALLIDGKTIPLKDNSADGVICINVYHELPDRAAVLSEIYRVIKAQGVFLLIDWEKENPVLQDGPPQERRIASPVMVQEMADAGFREIEALYGFNSHTAFRGRKPD